MLCLPPLFLLSSRTILVTRILAMGTPRRPAKFSITFSCDKKLRLSYTIKLLNQSALEIISKKFFISVNSQKKNLLILYLNFVHFKR